MDVLLSVYGIVLIFGNMISYIIYHLFGKKYKANGIISILVILVFTIIYVYVVKVYFTIPPVPGLERVC